MTNESHIMESLFSTYLHNNNNDDNDDNKKDNSKRRNTQTGTPINAYDRSTNKDLGSEPHKTLVTSSHWISKLPRWWGLRIPNDTVQLEVKILSLPFWNHPVAMGSSKPSWGETVISPASVEVVLNLPSKTNLKIV